MEISYKHLRVGKKLIATRCLIFEDCQESSPVGEGFALCSDQDNFSRKIGRELSFRRATKALLSKRTSLPIRRTTVAARELFNWGILFKSRYWDLSS